MSESDQDRPERDRYERGENEDDRGGCPRERPGGPEGTADGVPSAPPEHLAHLAHGVVELRKRGGIAARLTGPEGPRDGGPTAGEAAARDAHYAAGGGSDPCLEAMARRAADRAGRPRA
ncbi:hypothetical protein [Streptomyces sp. NPDC058701]|uniref:hypothetical protein n=1 Tax=Streptomyces sp. NPDC058701 TaxID=3346608 RepID=UPI0036473BF1